ncbi:methyl-accepting chemotaxis protein [Actinoplanes sp. CA-054009]
MSRISGLVGNLSVRASLTLLVVLTGILAVAVGVLSLSRMSTVAESGRNIYYEALLPSRDVATIREKVWTVRFEALTAATSADAELKTAAQKRMTAAQDVIDETITDYKARDVDDQQLTALNSFATAWGEYLDLRGQADALQAAGKTAEWYDLRKNQLAPKVVESLEYLETLSSVNVAAADSALTHAEDNYNAARVVVLIVLTVGLIVAVLLALFMANGVIRPLRQFRDVLNAVAEGDLTRRADINTRNEFGDMGSALGRATEKMRAAVGALAGGGDALATRAGHLQEASATLVNGADRTSGEVHSIGGAVDEVNARVGAVATGAEQMGAAIREIAVNAAEAASVAHEAVSASSTAEELMNRLGRSSTEIGDVVRVITSIAEQTNLLALNATIEAARAGESGKGFAVVAGEVKDLAQETTKATEDIGQRVAAIQADTGTAVEAITTIAGIIGRINEFQTTIASAVEQQSAVTSGMAADLTAAADGAFQIGSGISQVTEVADENRRAAHATNEAAADLTRLSDDLQQMVRQFRY